MNNPNLRDMPPSSLKITDFSLHPQFPIRTDFLCDSGDTLGEPGKIVDHFVNRNYKLLYLSGSLYVDDFLTKVTPRNCALYNVPFQTGGSHDTM